MALSDPVADMLTRIRNGLQAKKATVELPFSKLKGAILTTFKEGGFIENFEEFQDERGLSHLRVQLKYTPERRPVIRFLKVLSKPSRRVYSSYREIPRFQNGFGMIVVSTSKGVLSDKRAREIRAGGELICSIA